jgi:hypothetical protein
MMSPMRLRILFGTFALIIGLALYALVAMKIAVAFLPEHWAAELIYYIVAGSLWIFPAIRLTKWMQDLPPPPDRFAS